MAVTVVLQLQLKPDLADEVTAGLEQDLSATRAYEGNLSVALIRDQADPTHLTVIERWEERRHQESYIGWRESTGALEATAAVSAQAPTITYYDEIASL
jgi:heme oxygenase (mycobilin-producing)